MRPFLLFIFFYCMIHLSHAVDVITGAQRTADYLPYLKNKKVGLVVNQTSVIGNTHLIDSLISLGVQIKTVFAPEHGFRGTADAGEHVDNGMDKKTGIPLISLYGDNKKPKPNQLKDLDIVVFDIQDVGVRFYTYISTLQYVMEACAENNKPLIVLDRPNPNGHYVDGPVLDTQFRSFVGMQQIPVVYGMTIGEYARMLNGEKWLAKKAVCKLTVISCKNYNHTTFYSLPVKPSPNLPNMTAIYLYPSLCLFEGTDKISLGRGTDKPFQIYGSDLFSDDMLYQFTPQSREGAKSPPLMNKLCYGYDLSELPIDSLRNQKFTLRYFLQAYNQMPDKNKFLNSFFNKLMGSTAFPQQLEKGMSEKAIRASWQTKLNKFKLIRKKYLLYKDFE
ncbi:MAG TPA: DUF1343 domain-containing protein [Chitinophagales bacterium]|nr:DUF1343 domain-containing protein [Chitinophagales bacterium]